MSSTPMSPGTSFGPFEVVGLLGAGGMGEVHRARDGRLARDVALKVLPASLAASPEFVERFEREARILAALNHPNVAAIHGLERHEGITALVLELVDGPTLGEWISSERRPIGELLRVAGQIAAALEAAHQRSIVHRDLKPANIRISRDGTAKVLDFGIARSVAPVDEWADTARFVTAAGSVLGTPGYLAPEQAVGGSADTRSDVWSFGVILFEMLTRRPAFLRPSVRETFAAALTGQVPWEMLPPSVPSTVRSLLESCLSPSPERRPRDGAALRTRLEACTAEPGDARETPSLLVLPFENVGGDLENESFADGLTEEVIADLSNIDELRVFSRATALRYRAERRDAALAARELKAGYVLDGSVRRAGGRVRVAVQLVETTRDAPVWSDKYSGALDHVFMIQEAISRSIASALRLKLAALADRRFAVRRRGSAAAYDVYLSTRADVDSFVLDRLERARSRLERALEELGPDPYLYRGLGRVAWQFENAGLSHDPVHRATLDDCIRHLDAMDPKGAHALALRALRAMISGDVGAWYRALERVEMVEPGEVELRLWKSMVLSWVGRTEEGRAIVNGIAELDPYNKYVAFARVVPTLLEGLFDDARRIAERALEDDPGSAAWPCLLAQVLGSTGDREGARAAVAAHLPDPEAGGLASLAHVFVAALDADQARVDRLMTPAFERLMWNDFQYCHMVAQCCALLGRKDEALRWLERAVERGFLHHRFFRFTDPLLAPLRGDEAFEVLCDRAKAAAEEFPGEDGAE